MKSKRCTNVIACAKLVTIIVTALSVTGHLRDMTINIPEANSQLVNDQLFSVPDMIPVSIANINYEDSDLFENNEEDSNEDNSIEEISNNTNDSSLTNLGSSLENIAEEVEKEAQKEQEKTQETFEETTEEANRPYTDDEILLATVIHAEAGICDEHEKLLVGSVVLNRVDSSKFPNTVSGVIYQKGQFVSVNGRVWNNETPDESEYKIARKLIEGYRECPANVVWFSKRCDFGTRYTKTQWHEYGAE